MSGPLNPIKFPHPHEGDTTDKELAKAMRRIALLAIPDAYSLKRMDTSCVFEEAARQLFTVMVKQNFKCVCTNCVGLYKRTTVQGPPVDRTNWPDKYGLQTPF